MADLRIAISQMTMNRRRHRAAGVKIFLAGVRDPFRSGGRDGFLPTSEDKRASKWLLETLKTKDTIQKPAGVLF